MDNQKIISNDTINRRIEALVAHLTAGKLRRFCAAIGVQSPVLSNIIGERQSKPSTETLQKIAVAYPDVNMRWLLTGQGEMLYLPGEDENLAEAYRQIEKKEELISALIEERKVNSTTARPWEPTRAGAGALGKFEPIIYGQNLHPDALLQQVLDAGLGAWAGAVN